ncbi:MAG: helix-turn-helix transcriptional regulator, partial [Oscillospiraceae bacterium]|nr:helix-turn-helix transcriptional regulator [Oscillospiraceae bacterium]
MTAKQIAEAAGVGKATIYDYFSSKEEILVQALIYTLRIQNEK